MNQLMNKILKKLRVISEVDILKKQGVFIGENVTILNCYLDKTHPWLIKIGNNCTLTNCTILTHDASLKKTIGKSKIGKVTIGDNVFVGWGTIILPNVSIGDNSIIAAGSVVTKDVPSNVVYGGNPAHLLFSKEEFVKKTKENMKKHPVYSTNYFSKSPLEKEQQQDELSNGNFGYDE